MKERMILTNSRNNVAECLVLDGGLNLSRAQRAIESEEISDETSNVGCGHRSSRKGLGRSVVGSGNDIETGGPDVDASTEVREIRLGVGDSGGSDSDGLPDPSRGDVDNVLVLVTGSNDNRDAGVKELDEGSGN